MPRRVGVLSPNGDPQSAASGVDVFYFAYSTLRALAVATSILTLGPMLVVT